MLNKNFSYILLPLFLGLFTGALANEPIIIAEADAEVPAQTQGAQAQTQSQPQTPAQNQEAHAQPRAAQAETAAGHSEASAQAPLNTEISSPKEEEAVFKSDEGAVSGVEPEITLEGDGKKLEKKAKKQKKKKNDYSEYLIPEDGYLPVGDVDDRQIQIRGSISKSDELSLGDCLELALANNPKIKAAFASSSAVKENKVQTVSNYSPTISANTGISRVKPDMSGMPAGFSVPSYTKYLLGTISLSQLVYDFGVTQNQYTINKIEWETSKQNVESVVNTVLCDVKDAYYNLLYTISAKQVRYETVEQYQQMYDQAKAFYEIGTHPKVDVTIAAANLADAKANYIQATNAVDIAVSKLNNAMGTPFIAPYVVDTSMPYKETDITMKEAIEIANQARPDLKMAISKIQQADESVKLAKKVYLPQLKATADLGMGGRSDFTDKNWYTVGGFLEFPVINPVLITSQVKQAKALLEQQKYDTKSSVNDIYYEIQTAYVSLIDARQRIAASKVAVQQARESYELSQGRYKAGVCDAIELKEAQVTYEDTKLAYISNIYTYNSAKASLEKAIGQNLKETDIQENVEI